MASSLNSFGDAVISKPVWSAHSLDLMLCDLIFEEVCKTACIKAVHSQGMKLKKQSTTQYLQFVVKNWK